MRTRSLICVPLLALLGACYQSTVPLGTSETATVDGRLVGHWEEIDPEGETAARMTVLDFNGKEYYVRYCCSGGSPDTLRLRAYTTFVAGVPFINFQDIHVEREERVFSFARYAVAADGTLSVRMVSDSLFKQQPQFDSSEALYRFVQQNLNNPALYDGEGTRFRKTEP